MRRLIMALALLVVKNTSGFVEDSTKSEMAVKIRWYAPTHIPVQFAGNIGWLSTGLGFSSRNDNYQLAASYGYVPRSIGGTVSHLLTLKNTFHLYHFQLSRTHTIMPYFSAGASIELAGRSFFSLPESMPDDYYHFPKSIRFIPGAGLKMRYESSRVKPFQSVEFFAEASSYDVLVAYAILSKHVPMKSVVSLALGINLMIR